MGATFSNGVPRNRGKMQASDIVSAAFNNQHCRVKSWSALGDFTADAISEVNSPFR